MAARGRGGALDEGDGLLARAVVGEQDVGDVPGDVECVPAVDVDAEFGGQPAELGLVGDLVPARLPVSDGVEHLEDVAPVVGVCRGAGRDGAAEVAGDDHVGVGTADALRRPDAERVDTAGPHRAVAAAHAEHAVATLRLLCPEPVPDGLDTVGARLFDHLLGVRLDAQRARRNFVVQLRCHRWAPIG